MQYKNLIIAGFFTAIIKALFGLALWIYLLNRILPTHLSHSAGIFRSKTNIIWWALILGSLAFASLITYVIAKAKTTSIKEAALIGGIIGFLVTLAVDSTMYAQVNLFGRTFIGIDVIGSLVITSIMGATIGWVLTKKKML